MVWWLHTATGEEGFSDNCVWQESGRLQIRPMGYDAGAGQGPLWFVVPEKKRRILLNINHNLKLS